MTRLYYYRQCWLAGATQGEPAIVVNNYVVHERDARKIARLAYRRRRMHTNGYIRPRQHKCETCSLKFRSIFICRAGHVNVGCTTVMWNEISRMGRKLGWFKGLKPLNKPTSHRRITARKRMEAIRWARHCRS